MNLSKPMKRALLNLLQGQPVYSHCKMMSDYGGLESTMFALKRRGLVSWHNKLTKEGRRVAKSLTKP